MSDLVDGTENVAGWEIYQSLRPSSVIGECNGKVVEKPVMVLGRSIEERSEITNQASIEVGTQFIR